MKVTLQTQTKFLTKGMLQFSRMNCFRLIIRHKNHIKSLLRLSLIKCKDKVTLIQEVHQDSKRKILANIRPKL